MVNHETGTDDKVGVEVITIGRVSVDLYPAEIGLPLRQIKAFSKFLGRGPTDGTVAAAR